jgi:hypothetical protein
MALLDLLLDLIQDLKHRGQDPEKLPPTYWTAAVHRILLHPALLDKLPGEEIPCAS